MHLFLEQAKSFRVRQTYFVAVMLRRNHDDQALGIAFLLVQYPFHISGALMLHIVGPRRFAAARATLWIVQADAPGPGKGGFRHHIWSGKRS
jgi:hypothetical protein